jgi:hypothetical protein
MRRQRGLLLTTGFYSCPGDPRHSPSLEANNLRKQTKPSKCCPSALSRRNEPPAKSCVSAVNMQRYVGISSPRSKDTVSTKGFAKPGLSLSRDQEHLRRRLLGLGLLRSRLRLRLLLRRGLSGAGSSGGLGLGRGPEGLWGISVGPIVMFRFLARTRLSRRSCMIRVLSL